MICSIDGCERTVHARGWCHAHYTRWRFGRPMHRSLEPESLLCECPVPAADPTRAFGQCFICYRKPFALMADAIRAQYPQFERPAAAPCPTP